MGTPHISDRLRELTRPTGEEDLLKVAYPQPRLRVPVWQAGIVVTALAAALVVWLGLSRSGAHDFSNSQLDALEVSPAPAAHPSAPPTPTPTEVVVSVVGEVERPGLVTLPLGARVADALDQARPKPEANLMVFNHALRLEDGQQIQVVAHGQEPVPLASGPSTGVPDASDASRGTAGASQSGGGTAEGKVNLNTASEAELTTLSGVGKVTAAAIIAHREEIGGFTSVQQLLDVSGIGPAKFAKLERQVMV